MRSWAAVLLAALACCAPRSVAGQGEIVVDAGVGAFAGGDFRGLPPGPALGIAVHVTRSAANHGGFEIGYSRHAGGGVESATTQLEFVGLLRYPLVAGPVEAWAGGKLGFGRRSLTVVDEPARADGFIFGPSAAVRFPVSSVTVQLTVDALYQSFEELWMYGAREYGTDEDGLRVAFRAGLVVPLRGLTERARDP